MKYQRYEYSADEDLHIYEFISVGNKGRIRKVVEYSEMNLENFYNLAFGDIDENTGEINDEVITNNGDSLKVLSTVASTVYAFVEKHPYAWIFATGSNEVRTRLYRMGITNNLVEIQSDFHVFGMLPDETFEEFIVGEDYIGFLIKRKIKSYGNSRT
ncbi:MAG: hypothetical protein K9H64_09490 [Bacteroidales bacterium]|nr:hypothetical protein [Bacteroidales bacterium]MCF8456098.1 hypothetical protein [Bacteroidales bacterium]